MQFLEKSIVMDSKRPVQDLFVPLLVDIAGSHVEAIVLYGSHLSGTVQVDTVLTTWVY